MPLRELPMLPRREPSCPAAEKVGGATGFDGGCVCRIMAEDQEAESGAGMNPRQLEVAREGTGGVYLTVKSDPGTVLRLCFGQGIPVVTDEDGQRRDHHSYCPVFQRHKDRLAAARRRLFDPGVEDGVAMGMERPDPAPPTERDLELLAPKAATRGV